MSLSVLSLPRPRSKKLANLPWNVKNPSKYLKIPGNSGIFFYLIIPFVRIKPTTIKTSPRR